MTTPPNQAESAAVQRDGNWMDRWGACKVCGGEIPHGHAEHCDIYGLEKKVSELTKLLEAARPQAEPARPQFKGPYVGRDRLRIELVEKITLELDRAYSKHGRAPWSRHEFYAILLEEVDDLWDAIKKDAPQEDVMAELTQVAAMCFRYWETCRGKGTP